MSVDEALEHVWLADPALGDVKLSTDCLREFKYKHNWLVSFSLHFQLQQQFILGAPHFRSTNLVRSMHSIHGDAGIENHRFES